VLDSGIGGQEYPAFPVLWRTRIDSTFDRCGARPATRAPYGLVLPALGLLLLGLLANLSSREEVYANPEYGFSVLALFGAAGCIGHCAANLSRRSGTLDFACCGPIRVVLAAVPGGVPAGADEWPALIALLFGPFVFLLSGLGGWV
jgi:hypothetical protein